MKKIKVLLCILLILCAVFTSCTRGRQMLPSSSENFNEEFVESFFENYALVDPQLAYFYGELYEVEFENIHNIYHNTIRVGQIKDTDKNMFLSVSDIEYPGLFGSSTLSYSYVYQSVDAPSPMTDWSVKRISLFGTEYYVNHGETQDNRREPDPKMPPEYVVQNLMARSTERPAIAIFESDTPEGPAFIEAVLSAYGSEESISAASMLSVDLTPEINDSMLRNYFLLIEFEESSNIVWYSYLYKTKEYDGSFYIERQTVDENGKCTSYYGKISDETTAILKALLIADGWVEEVVEKESETSASSETTDPLGTTADPEITRDEPLGEGASA